MKSIRKKIDFTFLVRQKKNVIGSYTEGHGFLLGYFEALDWAFRIGDRTIIFSSTLGPFPSLHLKLWYMKIISKMASL